MFVDSEQAKDMVDNNTVVVVVDTNRPSYTECEELLHMTKTIVVLSIFCSRCSMLSLIFISDTSTS